MNENDLFLDSLIDDEINAGPRIAAATTNANPEDGAKALRLAQLTGVPAPVVYNQLPEFEAETKSRMAADLVRSSPELRQLVANEYMAARTASDDYGNLVEFSQKAKATAGMLIGPVGRAIIKGQIGAVEGAAEGFGGHKFGSWITDTEYGKGFAERNPWSTAAWTVVGAPIEGIFRGMGAFGGAVSGAVREGAKGLGADENTANSLAREAMGIMESMGGSPGATHVPALGAALKSPLGRRLAPTALAEYNAAIREQARTWVDFGFNPPVGVSPILDQVRGEANKIVVEAIRTDVEAAQMSATRERAPAIFETFAKQHYGDKELGISYPVVAELYKDKLPEAGDGLLGWVPGLAEQMEVSRTTGQDIRVPVADWVSKVDPALAKALEQDIRAIEDGVTAREAIEPVVMPKPDVPDPVAEVRAASGLDSVFIEAARQKVNEAAKAAEETTGKPLEPEARGLLDPIAAEALGLDQRTKAKLEALIEKRNAEDFEAALKRAEKIERKTLTADWRTKLNEVRAEIEAQMYREPAVMADLFLTAGELFGEKSRQRYTLAIDQLTPEQQAKLPRSYMSKNGIPLDDVAQLFGFETRDALVNALISLNEAKAGKSVKEYLAKEITQAAKEENIRRNGNLDDTILDAAKERALSETSLEILEEEMYAAAMKAQRETVDKVTAYMYADELFDKSRAKDISSDKLLAHVGKLAMDATKALIKGDLVEALYALERRTLTAIMAKMAKDFEQIKANLDATAEIYQKETNDAVAREFIPQIQNLLRKAGYKINLAEDQLQRGREFFFDDFINSLDAAGRDPEIPDWVRAGEIKHVDEMSAAEFKEFAAAIQSLDGIGRRINNINVMGQIRKWDDVKAEILERIMQGKLRDAKSMGEKGNLIYGIAAELLRPETIIKQLDQGDLMGPFWRATVPELESSKSNYFKMQDELVAHFRATNAKLGKEWRDSLNDPIPQKLILDPRKENRGYLDMTRSNLIQLMLHWGTRENINQVVRSFFYAEHGVMPKVAEMRAFEKQLKDLIDKHATREDWEYVRALHEPFKKWAPVIDTVQLNMTGVAAKLLKPIEIETPFGNFEGGYWPMKYDKLRSKIDSKKASADTIFDNNYYRAATAKSYLKKRQGYDGFVDLEYSIEGSLGRMQQMMFDVSFRESLAQAAKVVYDADISNAVKNYYGVEFERQLKPWLKEFAGQYQADNSVLASISAPLKWARTRLTAFALPLSWGVLLSPAPGRIRFAMLRRSGYFADVEANKALVMKHSKEVQHMLYNMDRDYREAMERITTEDGWHSISRKAVEGGFKLSTILEQKFRMATFYVEFVQAKSRGLSDAEAAALADRQVREWHGVSHPLDLAPLFRSKNEFTKMFTLFQGFFNTVFNKTFEIPGQVRRGEWKEITDTAVSFYVAGTIINMALNPPKRDESTLHWFARNAGIMAFAQLPGVSHFSNYLIEGYAPRQTYMAILQMIQRTWNDSVKMAQGKPADKMIKHSIDAAGIILKLPTPTIGNAAQFTYDVNTGKQYPQNILEYINGIKTGEAKPKR